MDRKKYETGPRDILIVDDEFDVRTFYREILRRKGYTFEEAADGKDAFRFTNRNRYGLVITDLRMPDWSGLDFIVSAGLVNPNQRILVIDKLTPEIIEELQGETNVVGWLEKPVTRSILRAEVAKYVEPSKSAE